MIRCQKFVAVTNREFPLPSARKHKHDISNTSVSL